MAEIHEETSKPRRKRKDVDDNDEDQPGTSKPKKKRREVDDDDGEKEEDLNRLLKAPVMARGLVIWN